MKPKTALIAAASAAAPKDSRYEATARSSMSISNSCAGGMPSARITIAASGSRMIALRKNVVKPNVSPKPGSGLGATMRPPAMLSPSRPVRARSAPGRGCGPSSRFFRRAASVPSSESSPSTSMELRSTASSRASSSSGSPKRSSVRRSRPCSVSARERASSRSRRREARSRSGVADSWIASSTDSAGNVAQEARGDAERADAGLRPRQHDDARREPGAGGITRSCEAPCARFHSAVALASAPAASTGMPGGALGVRVVRIVMRVCMRAASVAKQRRVAQLLGRRLLARDDGEARDRRRQAVDATCAHRDFLADRERVRALLRERARGVEQPAGAVRALAIGRRGHRPFHRHAHAQALGRARELQFLHHARADGREAALRLAGRELDLFGPDHRDDLARRHVLGAGPVEMQVVALR